MSRNIFKKRTYLFYQYLISYVLVLLIPLIIVGVVVYSSFVNILEEQTTSAHEDVLNHTQNLVDTKLSEMMSISVDISLSRDLTPYRLTNFHNVYMAKSLLKYTEGNEFLYDVIFYLRGGEYLYSASSSYRLSLFYNDMFHYQDWPLADFQTTMNTVNNPELRVAENVKTMSNKLERYVSYLVPIPINSVTPYGTALFLINEESLLDMLQVIDNYKGGNSMIMDEEGKIVTSFAENSYMKSPEFLEFVDQISNEGTERILLDGVEYYISYIHSGETSWTYMTLIPEAELMKTANGVKNNAIIALFIIIVVGSGLIYYGIHTNYKPVGKLIKFTEEKWGKTVDGFHGVDKVQSAMEYADTISRELTDKVEMGQPILRQHLLLNLLKGNRVSREEFNQEGTEIGLTLLKEVCFVMLIYVEREGKDAGHLRWLAEKWIDHLPNKVEGHFVELFETDKCALIITNDHDATCSEAQWTELHQQFMSKHKITFTLGVGGLYEELNAIGKSYLEASVALQYKLIKGNDTIIFFRETAAVNRNPWYPEQELENLELYLRQANSKGAVVTIEHLIGKINQMDITLFTAKYICFDVMSTVIRSLNSNHQGTAKNYPNALSIIEIQTITELEQTLMDVCSYVIQIIGSASEELFINEILAYMDQNFEDYNFSVQSMAQHFSLSSAYIRKYFKEQTNRTVTDYLNELRMEKAKEMIRTTEMQLQDIVLKIGYSDVSSFIRKFKQYVGMTPGEYRKMHTSA